MRKLALIGTTAIAAAILSAAPISVNWSAENTRKRCWRAPKTDATGIPAALLLSQLRSATVTAAHPRCRIR